MDSINGNSLAEIQLPARLGNIQNRRHTPALRTVAAAKPAFPRVVRSISLFWKIRASAMMPKSGMVNSAMTRADDTVRNLLYIGRWSIRKCVTAGTLCPQAKTRDRMVAAANAHFMGPFTMNSPSMKRKHTKAPTYTGPTVIG